MRDNEQKISWHNFFQRHCVISLYFNKKQIVFFHKNGHKLFFRNWNQYHNTYNNERLTLQSPKNGKHYHVPWWRLSLGRQSRGEQQALSYVIHAVQFVHEACHQSACHTRSTRRNCRSRPTRFLQETESTCCGMLPIHRHASTSLLYYTHTHTGVDPRDDWIMVWQSLWAQVAGLTLQTRKVLHTRYFGDLHSATHCTLTWYISLQFHWRLG